jgi:hypothetical protein
MPVSYNGIWISDQGYAITILNPNTIWATLDHRHYSAFKVVEKGTGIYTGLFDASRSMNPGYSPDPQIVAQYNLLQDTSGEFPTKNLGVPTEIPCVPAPLDSDPSARGTVEIKTGSDPLSLHIAWTDASGQVDFSGNTSKVGGDEQIDLNGAFVDGDLTIALADAGKGPKRSLVGTVIMSGVSYQLKGLRVWGRGPISLFAKDSDTEVGRGWIEWDPSSKFFLGLKGGKPQPTDRVMSYIEILRNGSYLGATHLLTRTADQ